MEHVLIENASSIRALVDQKVDELRKRLHDVKALIGPASVFVVGALETGLYIGAKPKYLSLNPSCPFDNIIEADVRIVLEQGRHPHDKALIQTLSGILKPDFAPGSRETWHWDKRIPTTYFYRYEKITNELGFEWEFSLNEKPYMDVALYWKKLFSPVELDHQKNIRSAIRTLAPLSYEDEYTPAKMLQTFEARWRLVASYALLELKSTGQVPEKLLLPVKGTPEEPVKTLTQKWLAGESGYRTMERPSLVIPDNVRERLQKAFGDKKLEHLLIKPPAPEWVGHADQIQRQLKSR